MLKTIRSKILILVIGLMAVTSMTFIFITTNNYQTEITGQHYKLAKETLTSTIRAIDNEYTDLLSYEINSIKHQRFLMEDLGAGILSMVDLFYDLQKTGLLTEQLAKEQCLKRIKEYRYHKTQYFFVCDFNLTGLSHPNKEMVGKSWYGFEDLKKKDALTLIRETIKIEKTAFTVFMWPRLEDLKQVKQMGVFLYYPQWEWIIGTVQEMSDIEKESLDREKHALFKLNNILGQMSLNEIGGVLVFDSHGKVIIHTSNLKNIDLNPAGITLNKSIQDQLEKAASDSGKPIEYQYTNGSQGEMTQVAYVDHFKYMDWYVTTFVDKNESLEASSVIAIRQFMILVLILLFGIIFAVFISKKITFPLRMLTKYARDLPDNAFTSNGNTLLESIVSSDHNDEIKQLADSFVYMETKLGENFQELEKHKNHLELLINLKTKELTDANISLTLEVTERKHTEEKVKNLNKALDRKVKERTNELKRLNEHIIYAEENERKAVAVDLHDSVAQSLALSISKIKNIQESCEPNNLEIISEIQGHLELAVKETRSLIYQLSPPILDDFEIDIALGFLIEESNQKHDMDIKYINIIDNPIHLTKSNKTTLYRSVNELINNIIKHSGSKDAEIEISKKENFILLRVEDTGVGFDSNKFTKKNFYGFGIYSISERIKNLGGNFVLFSKLGKGTKILLSIPILSESDIENGKNINNLSG